MVAADLQLLPVLPAHFQRAAALLLDAAHGLRAGDALHLAVAEAAGVLQMATLDDVLARNAHRLQIKTVPFLDPA
jgi:predicted nucleic acid-binding protein